MSEPPALIVVAPETWRLPRVVSEPPASTVIAPGQVAPSPASIVMSSTIVASALPHCGSDGVMVMLPVVNTPVKVFVRNVERTRS